MPRAAVASLASLALAVGVALAGCVDTELPTAAHAPAFAHVAGHCEVTSDQSAGPGSLRDLIADPDCDVITFAAGIETVWLTTAGLLVDRNVHIQGPGTALLTVRPAQGTGIRVFRIEPGATVVLSGMTISHGIGGTHPIPWEDPGHGGGIVNRGNLTLRSVRVVNSVGANGAGIASLGGTLRIEESEVSNNDALLEGAGILLVEGAVATIDNSRISDNRVPTVGRGGGIAVIDSELEVTKSSIVNNLARGWPNSPVPFGGGGIFMLGSNVRIVESTISGNQTGAHNSAWGPGAGLDAQFTTLVIENSTISNNVARDPSFFSGGGGLHVNRGTATLVHTTITGNRLVDGIDGFRGVGGGILVRGVGDATLELRNSIVSGNEAETASQDLVAGSGSQISVSHTLIGHPTGHDVTHGVDGNLVGTAAEPLDALFGPLQDNGGPTWTHALLAGSPAGDAVPFGTHGCGTTFGGDQRGVFRPQGAACDMGAFEREQATDPLEALGALIDLAAATDGLTRGTRNKLDTAKIHVEAGRLQPACDVLSSFIDDVQARSGTTIDPADAAALIDAAEAIRTLLGC